MFKLIYRNLLLYYKSISNVFFSFLGMLISLVIYIFFLKNNLVDSLNNVPNAAKMVDTWMVAGLISIVAITSPLSAFAQKVEDKDSKGLYDILINSRFSLYKVNILYIFTAIIEGMISTIIFSGICYAYLISQYKYELTVDNLIIIILYIVCLVLFASSLFSIITLFINSTSFSSLSAIVGTLAGFLSGSYIVIGSLPKTVQNILKYWPGFEIAGLLRNRLMPLSNNVPSTVSKSLGVVKDNQSLISIFMLIFAFFIIENIFIKLKKVL
ncbi:hypothetical protein [Limosilactobacillus allomucosae]|uniref:ABC transporter permease n=1 Tax=Limosilactobacillus allomucosae TaxID=3142938 RepID=A0ABV0I4Z2_9LACO